MTEKLQKTYDFLKKTFDESEWFKSPENAGRKRYRFEHSIRVCKAGLTIAQGEGFSEEKTEALQIACLLHDIAYTIKIPEGMTWEDHGRIGAKMARPFLEELGYSGKLLEDMVFGIGIHADGKADFPGEYNEFTVSVPNADDIDRFGFIRDVSSLENSGFENMEHQQRLDFIWKNLGFYKWSLENEKYGTETAKKIITEQLEFQIKFWQGLSDQQWITKWE